MKLSIITPYYKTYEQTLELSKHLIPQLKNDIEWIIVDDGCLDRRLDSINTKVVHLAFNSGNASVPRNIGMFYAKGEYIAFIDSDDDVTDNYVEKIEEKINEGFDCCFLSWENERCGQIIMEDEPPSWNTCVWNRVYHRDFINNVKFNPIINIGEDKDFNNRVIESNKDKKDIKKTVIKDVIYIYKDRPDSIMHQYCNGKLKAVKDA